jgi:hypothetical protein
MDINFGFANDKGLKRLVAYGLPCMYTEIELIDPKAIRQFIINKKFNTYAKSVFKILKPYEDSIKGIEKDVYDLLKAESNHYPDKKIKELVEGLLPTYKEQLINRQQDEKENGCGKHGQKNGKRRSRLGGQAGEDTRRVR